MTVAQFTSDWNDVFELKITVGDIKKPTQSFLLDALQLFLTSIGIDCDKLKAKMDERKYKIMLVKYFNDFFEACNFKQNFIYGDLIQPNSKKVFLILRFLLNYYLFFKALKEDVVHIANEKVETYNQLLSQKNELQLQQEEFKIRSKQKELALANYTRLIAENKQLLVELEAQSTLLTKDTESATEELYRIRDENIKLTNEVKQLEPLVVSEDELNALMRGMKTIDADLSELNSLQELTISKGECFVQELIQMNGEIDEFSTFSSESSVLDLAEKYRDEVKSLTELNNKIKEIQHRIQNTLISREKLLDGIKSLEVELLKRKQDLSSIVGSGQIKTIAMESEYKRGLIHNANYEKKLETAEQQIEDLKLVQEHLITMGNDVVEQIEMSENWSMLGKAIEDF